MKRFLLFSGSNYYPMGGWYDLKGLFMTLESATRAASKYKDNDWWHIVDADTLMIVATEKGMIEDEQH